MEDNSMDLVFSKPFQELSLSERNEMRELFTTEEEFNQIKMVMHSINEQVRNSAQDIQPSEKTKERLDHLFHQTYQGKGILWYNSVGAFFISSEKKWYSQNVLRIAAIFLLVLATYPFWNSDLKLTEKTLTAKNEAIEKQKQDQSNSFESGPTTATAEEKQLLDSEMSGSAGDKITESDLFIDKLTDKGTDTWLKQDDHSNFQPLEGQKKQEDVVATDASVQPLFSTGMAHPDGIFNDVDAELAASKAVFAVKEHQSVLDLLTPTY